MSNKLVDTALSYEGKLKYSMEFRYVEGFADCSSFVEKVHKEVGITGIGSYTEAQWTNKKYPTIAKSDLRVGDTVYFKNTYPSGYTDGVSHTGIYIGKGQFVHCSSNGGVKVSDLNSSYWTAHWLGAKDFGGRRMGVVNYEDTLVNSASDRNQENVNSLNPLTYLKEKIQESLEPIIISIICILLVVGGVVFVGATAKTM